MKLKPTGKYLKAYLAGCKAYTDGEKIEKNPNKYGSDCAMSSWWDAGWENTKDADQTTGAKPCRRKSDISTKASTASPRSRAAPTRH